jgi:hypothetical protein
VVLEAVKATEVLVAGETAVILKAVDVTVALEAVKATKVLEDTEATMALESVGVTIALENIEAAMVLEAVGASKTSEGVLVGEAWRILHSSGKVVKPKEVLVTAEGKALVEGAVREGRREG